MHLQISEFEEQNNKAGALSTIADSKEINSEGERSSVRALSQAPSRGSV